MRTSAVIGFFFLFHALVARAAEPLNPDVFWSRIFLANQILVDEYASYLSSQATSDTALRKAQRSKETAELLKRAYFAVELSRSLEQDLGDTTALRGEMLRHESVLKTEKPKRFAELKNFQDDPLKEQLAKIEAGLKDPSLAAFLKHVAGGLQTAAVKPSCQVGETDLAGLAAIQKEQVQSGVTTRTAPVAAFLSNWNNEKIRCLAISLMHKSERQRISEFEPLIVFSAVFQASAPARKDMPFATLYGVRLLQKRQYAEALRILFDLTKLDPEYRVLYDRVQKIFSYRQKGEGSVALKGL